MQLGDLLREVDTVKINADLHTEIGSICYDTRKQETGAVFIAIRGFESDGHMYISDAVSNGAVCVICESEPDVSTPYIIVRNAREALALVSAAWFGHPESKLIISGVTGTNGKTTVTTVLKQVIEKCTGQPVGLVGSYVNMLGSKETHAERTTPESYEIFEFLAAAVKEGCKHVVLEVSSHALELYRVHGIEFEVGVYTNLTPDHLDFHPSMDEYAKAKSLLFASSRYSVINSDDAYAEVMINNAHGAVTTYAVDDSAADITARSIKLMADKVDFCVLTVGILKRVELNIPGMFSVYNALAVISAALLLGFDLEQIGAVLPECKGVRGRAEIVPTDGDFTVLIDHAHSPDALKNIITAARGFSRGRVVILFGCGGDRDKTKRPLMGEVAAKLANFVIVTSDNPRTEEPEAIINDILAGIGASKTPFRAITNRREAIYWALDRSLSGDVLILAGKGHEDYQVIGKVKSHFDEREVVADWLQENRTGKDF